MQKTAEYIIRGSSYYEASRLYEEHKLYSGAKVLLSHQPFNIHDENAVAITLKNTGEMLGHLPREVAANYVASVKSGLVTNACNSRIKRKRVSLNFYVRVSWFEAVKPVMPKMLPERNKTKHNLALVAKSFQVKDLSKLEVDRVIELIDIANVAGVYAIRCEKNERTYIGASLSIKRRLGQHFSSLSKKTHHNSGMQSDYLKFGLASFTYFIVRNCIDGCPLAESEELAIPEFRNLGVSLYNLTDDGQGKIPSPLDISYLNASLPILTGEHTLTSVNSKDASVSNRKIDSKKTHHVAFYALAVVALVIIASSLITKSKNTQASIAASDASISMYVNDVDQKIAEAWNKLGVKHYDNKDYSEAINAFRQALRINPDDDNAWHWLGIIYSEIKQYSQAINAFQQALRINQKSAKAWFGLGVTYNLIGDVKKVQEIYSVLRTLDEALAEQYYISFILSGR